MARPIRCRRVGQPPDCQLFKPAGVPTRSLDQVTLEMDEFEALRLADHQGLYQQEAAERMGVSRQTFGRIIESARRKVARVLVEGLALEIRALPAQQVEMRSFGCCQCDHVWESPFGAGPPDGCPECQSDDVQRT